jgi:hypothetical protein
MMELIQNGVGKLVKTFQSRADLKRRRLEIGV